MPADSTELVSLNTPNLSKSCQNGPHYSALDETRTPDASAPDAHSLNQEERTNANDTLTDFEGFMLLIPTYIGIAFLGLPYMVKLLGLWLGSGGILFYGWLNEFAALILARSTQRLIKRTGERIGDIGTVVEKSMKLGPHCLQKHAGKFKFSMNFSILLNCALIILDLISVMNLLAKDALHPYVDISDTLSIGAITLLLLPLFLIRGIKLLSRVATTGNIALLGICIITFQYICRDLPDSSTRPASKPLDFIILTSFANDVMYSYGGIVLILPIRERMKIKKNFDGWNGLLGLAFAFVICVHISTGFYGYLKVGEMTQVNFILSLPSDVWIYKSVKILSFFIMYCTMGVNVFVVFELIWTNLKDRISMECFQNYGEYICRVTLLMLCCIITMLIPEYQLLMSLTGCFGSYYQTVIVPPIIAILTLYGEEVPTSFTDKVYRKIEMISCVIVLSFGIYSIITGVGVAMYTTVCHIVL